MMKIRWGGRTPTTGKMINIIIIPAILDSTFGLSVAYKYEWMIQSTTVLIANLTDKWAKKKNHLFYLP